jgi:hypothetical protein
MLTRLLAFALVLTLVPWMPLCLGMSTDTTMARQACCEVDGSFDAVRDTTRHGGSTPESDCCLLDAVPNPRRPADRTATDPASIWLPVGSGPAHGPVVPVQEPIRLSSADPPASPSLARHVLLCVFLI